MRPARRLQRRSRTRVRPMMAAWALYEDGWHAVWKPPLSTRLSYMKSWRRAGRIIRNSQTLICNWPSEGLKFREREIHDFVGGGGKSWHIKGWSNTKQLQEMKMGAKLPSEVDTRGHSPAGYSVKSSRTRDVLIRIKVTIHLKWSATTIMSI